MSTAKHWQFTLNNPVEHEQRRLQALGESVGTDSEIAYLGWGREKGDGPWSGRQPGTKHFQGYCSFRRRKSLAQVKRLLGERCHLEVCRGTPHQNREYIIKHGEFSEYGELPSGRGKRSDIEALRDAVKSGMARSDIADQFPLLYAKYRSAIKEWISDYAPKRTWAPEVNVFWGPTGTGKTRAVYEFIRHEDIFCYNGGKDGWFDGYDGQCVVLFDDFSGSDFKLNYLLRLLDRYPMKVPIKGGFVEFVPKHIFITSNLDPDIWYQHAHIEHQRALKRRFTKVVKYPVQ